MGTKVLATLTAIVGGIGVVYALLAAFGVNLDSDTQEAITGLLGLLLVVAGIWFHPSVPVGPSEPGA